MVVEIARPGLLARNNNARRALSRFDSTDLLVNVDDREFDHHGQRMMPVPNRLVLDDGPFIHPLVELLDEGRPAGVIIVTAEEARLLKWRLGEVTMVDQMQQDYVQASHERAGRIGGGPRGQFHTPMHEPRESRQRDRTHRFLDDVSERAAQFAEEHRQDRREAKANKFPINV